MSSPKAVLRTALFIALLLLPRAPAPANASDSFVKGEIEAAEAARHPKSTKRMYFSSHSLVLTVLNSNKPGLKIAVIGGVNGEDDWLNLAVRQFSRSEVAGGVLSLARIHTLNQNASASDDNTFINNYDHFSKAHPDLTSEIQKLIAASDITVFLIKGNARTLRLYGHSPADGESGPITDAVIELSSLEKIEASSRTPGSIEQLSRKFPDKLFITAELPSASNHRGLLDDGRNMLNSILKSTKTCAPLPSTPAYRSLINIKDISPDIIVDMKYATTDNFLNRKMYSINECYLNADVARKLVNTQEYLKKSGLGLKCFDCYRPHSVQFEMWKIVPDGRYVANPAKGSKHNRGIAVDLTLVNASGDQLEMPTKFDDFTQKAWRDYPDLNEKVKKHRRWLRDAMEKNGFTSIRTEWWHYDGASSRNHPLIKERLHQIE